MLGRILVAWTLAVFGSVAFASNISDVDLTKVPQCGLLCIVDTVAEKSSCSITDFPCICANATLGAEIESCFSSECSPRDALTTGKIAKDLCGVPPRNITLAVWLVPLITIIISTVFYGLRLLSRAVLHQGIDAGDIVLGVSVAFTFPLLWSAFKLAGYGLGQDVWNIPQDNITSILYLYWWAELLYQAALPLTRISILLFYLKVFPQDSIRWANFALIGTNVAYLFAFDIATIFQCFPVYGAWTFWDGSFDGHCNNVHLQSWLSAAFNILLDLLVIILPLPSLARLSVSRKKKIQILLMFSVGFFITIISIIRLKSLVVFANSTNVSYDYVEPGLYSIVETSVAIICGCLPAVRALLITFMPKVFGSGNRSGLVISGSKGSTPSSQKFDRLGSSHESHESNKGHIRVQTQWSVQENILLEDAVNSSDVELVPAKIRPVETSVKSGQGEEDGSPARPRNWSRPVTTRS
ncbi:hypothetical protein F5Y19DRAFT_93230 [Xylariaceae sp. FL1651]|nr:hypothetical protein F5Y19DRAFT_93230 [Xylariaceae sp. FL1651]